MAVVEQQLEVGDLVEQVVRSMSCEVHRPGFTPGPPTN